MNVLILAAGLGTRLRPLTSDVPKPLVPVVDKCILEQQTIKARTIGDVRLHANAHYLADRVVAEGKRLGFEKVWVEYPDILGTAGPLKRIYNEGYRGGLLVMNGDAFCNFDLKKFVQNAKEVCSSFSLKNSLGLQREGTVPGVVLLAVDFPQINTFRVGPDGHLNGVLNRFGVTEGAPATFSGVSYYSDEALSRIANGEFDIREFWKQEMAAGRAPFVDMSQMHATWIDMGSPAGLMAATVARLNELGIEQYSDDRVTATRNSIIFAGAKVNEGETVKNEIRGPDFVWNL